MPKFEKGNDEWKKSQRMRNIPVRGFRWDVSEICEKMGFNPFVRMIETANDKKQEDSVRLKATIELASYVAPKLRAIEIKGNQESPFMYLLNLAKKQVKDESTSTDV